MQLGSQVALSERDMGSQKCCLSHKRCPGLAAECDDLERGVGSGVPHRPDALPAEGIHLRIDHDEVTGLP